LALDYENVEKGYPEQQSSGFVTNIEVSDCGETRILRPELKKEVASLVETLGEE
jgi:hypothetical protein